MATPRTPRKPRAPRIRKPVDPTGRVDIAVNSLLHTVVAGVGAACGLPMLGDAMRPIVDRFTRDALPGKPVFTRGQLATAITMARGDGNV